MNLKCLILNIDNEVYAVEVRSSDYEIIKFSSEIKTKYTSTYWKDLIDKMGYIGESIDVLTLSTSTKFEIDSAFKNTNESTWKIKDITKIFKEFSKQSNQKFNILSYEDSNQNLEISLNGQKIDLRSNKKLGENITIDEAKIIEKKIVPKKEPPKGTIADFYKKETERIKKEKN